MAKGKPVLTHVTYMPKKGKEKELGELVKKHWPVLHKAGLTTDEPAKIWHAKLAQDFAERASACTSTIVCTQTAVAG